MIYFSIVGLLLGLILTGANNLLSFLNIEQFYINVMLIILLIVLTGGIHLDGLADVCDAFLSRKDREEMLKIMRDSHIGVMGVLSLISVILLKIAFLSSISISLKTISLFLVCALSRWSLVFAIFLFPYARKEGGLGGAFAEFSDWKCLLVASMFTGAVVLSIFRQKALLLIPSVVAFVCLIAWRLSKQLGGMTGDTYGALCELTEGFCLLLFSTKWM